MALTDAFLPSSWRDLRAEGRVRRLRVSPAVLVEMLKAHGGDRYYLNTKDPLPDDAVLLETVFDDALPDALSLLVGSAAFEPVDALTETPEIRPEVTVVLVPTEIP